jgi:hypothetical protein
MSAGEVAVVERLRRVTESDAVRRVGHMIPAAELEKDGDGKRRKKKTKTKKKQKQNMRVKAKIRTRFR